MSIRKKPTARNRRKSTPGLAGRLDDCALKDTVYRALFGQRPARSLWKDLIASALDEQPAMVRIPSEWKQLRLWVRQGKRTKINRFLKRRATEIVHHWKILLKLSTIGRPASKNLIYARALRLEDEGGNLPDIARTLDGSGYRKDARATIDRFRHGIEYQRTKLSEKRNPGGE